MATPYWNWEHLYEWSVFFEPKTYAVINTTQGFMVEKDSVIGFIKTDAVKLAKEMAEKFTDKFVIINLKTLQTYPIVVEKKFTVEGLN